MPKSSRPSSSRVSVGGRSSAAGRSCSGAHRKMDRLCATVTLTGLKSRDASADVREGYITQCAAVLTGHKGLACCEANMLLRTASFVIRPG